MELQSEIEAALEAHGFRRSIAGESDFLAVTRAVAQVLAREKTGIWFAGSVGVGKSFAANAAARTVSALAHRPPHRFGSAYNADQMARLVSTVRDGKWGDFLLDDIACEAVRREFGNEIDPFAEFTMLWDEYNLHGTGATSLLYITTNENAAGVQSRYGARVFDRLAWRLAPVEMEGSTKRGVVPVVWRESNDPEPVLPDGEQAVEGAKMFREALFDAARSLAQRLRA